ncbi:hypothetical protein GA0061084_2361 [Arthrobacter sp. NIO-1057]|nr:hypothetical protein GA0061084_2361 [Arthrobacter sp. NIO-1057]
MPWQLLWQTQRMPTRGSPPQKTRAGRIHGLRISRPGLGLPSEPPIDARWPRVASIGDMPLPACSVRWTHQAPNQIDRLGGADFWAEEWVDRESTRHLDNSLRSGVRCREYSFTTLLISSTRDSDEHWAHCAFLQSGDKSPNPNPQGDSIGASSNAKPAPQFIEKHPAAHLCNCPPCQVDGGPLD